MKYYSFFVILIILACNTDVDLREQSIIEIRETEEAFAMMATELGIKEAFVAFAADSAVLDRNNVLIVGIDSIKAHFSSPTPQGTTLEWTPDFVDASKSGDLGYTYGKYVYTRMNGMGKPQKVTGIFHTIWKRQDDGSWKYVWD